MPKKESFESQLNRLKEIVGKMEKGPMALEDALKLFEEGIAIYSDCNGQLEEAKQRVKLICDDGEVDFESDLG